MRAADSAARDPDLSDAVGLVPSLYTEVDPAFKLQAATASGSGLVNWWGGSSPRLPAQPLYCVRGPATVAHVVALRDRRSIRRYALLGRIHRRGLRLPFGSAFWPDSRRSQLPSKCRRQRRRHRSRERAGQEAGQQLRPRSHGLIRRRGHDGHNARQLGTLFGSATSHDEVGVTVDVMRMIDVDYASPKLATLVDADSLVSVGALVRLRLPRFPVRHARPALSSQAGCVSDLQRLLQSLWDVTESANLFTEYCNPEGVGSDASGNRRSPDRSWSSQGAQSYRKSRVATPKRTR